MHFVSCVIHYLAHIIRTSLYTYIQITDTSDVVPSKTIILTTTLPPSASSETVGELTLHTHIPSHLRVPFCISAQVSAPYRRTDITNVRKHASWWQCWCSYSGIAFSTSDTPDQPALTSLQSLSAPSLTDPPHYLNRERTAPPQGFDIAGWWAAHWSIGWCSPVLTCMILVLLTFIHMPHQVQVLSNTSNMCCSSLLVSATIATTSHPHTSCRHVVNAVWSRYVRKSSPPMV